jgi:glycerophosphoryl diester phosphodiesterase
VNKKPRPLGYHFLLSHITCGSGITYRSTGTFFAAQGMPVILGIFSDWPATVTFYANCMGLK